MRRSRGALREEKTEAISGERRCHLAMMIMTSGPDCQLPGTILHHNINNRSRLGSGILESFGGRVVFSQAGCKSCKESLF